MTPTQFATWCAAEQDPEAAFGLVDEFARRSGDRGASLASQVMAVSVILAELEANAPQRGLVGPAVAVLLGQAVAALDLLVVREAGHA